MLCNPRTQENSYVILGPAVALLAASALLIDRRRWATALLLAVCVVSGFHRAFSVHPNYWLQPLAALIFACYLVYITLIAAGDRETRSRAGRPLPAHGRPIAETRPAIGRT
jgi:hypothetical protein